MKISTLLAIVILSIFLISTTTCHAFDCHVGYTVNGVYSGATQSCPSDFVCYRYGPTRSGYLISGFTPTSNCESWKLDPNEYKNLICCTTHLCNSQNGVAPETTKVNPSNGNGTTVTNDAGSSMLCGTSSLFVTLLMMTFIALLF